MNKTTVTDKINFLRNFGYFTFKLGEIAEVTLLIAASDYYSKK